jgi:hypothetical protein
MDSKDPAEREPIKNSICSLEWIAWAMEAARRHKEAEPDRSKTELPSGADRQTTDLA